MPGDSYLAPMATGIEARVIDTAVRAWQAVEQRLAPGLPELRACRVGSDAQQPGLRTAALLEPGGCTSSSACRYRR